MNVTGVTPTYNEAGTLPELLEALQALPVPGLRVLVVDDASPDGTGRLADRLAAGTPDRVEVLHRRGPRGLGRAYVDGVMLALDRGADIVVLMDADLSHAPGDIPRLIGLLEGADLVIGSRYVPGGGIDASWGFGRKVLSRSANALARTVLGLRTLDTTAGFRAWRRQALLAVEPGRVTSGGYLFQVEMTYICEKLGLRIVETPIHFAKRRFGRSKMSFRVKLEAAVGLLRVWRLHHLIRPRGRSG